MPAISTWTNVNKSFPINIASATGLVAFPTQSCSEVTIYNPTSTVFYVTKSLTATLSGLTPVLGNTTTTIYGLTNANQLSAVVASSTDIYAVAKYFSISVQPW